jgi:signal transduction histidine kinase
MNRRGSLPAEARLTLAPHPALARLPELSLQVAVDAWNRQLAATESRFALKSSLLVLCGMLALGLAAFALLAQERKRRFVELKGDFVATVSHELKTPLASIRLLAETLDASGSSETTREYPARIVRAADTLHFLVQNILTFNALGKSPAAVRTGPVRLEELLVPLRRELEEAFGERVQLTSELGETEVEGDPALLQLVFSNLARNACLYNRRSPIELRVRARTDTRSAVTVLFEDNGVGIASADRRRIFQDFVRAVQPGVEAHGSGLGLALCRRILRQHGGKIRLAETGPEGTTFSLHFPALR